MSRGKTPRAGARSRAAIPGILELDRFSQESLTRWNALSNDLDELQATLFFGVRPEQRRLRADLTAHLQDQRPEQLLLERWARIVTYQFSLAPLSAAGSLRELGGRFNAGKELDPGTLEPWPALYVAEDYETAFREKFQMPSNIQREGLTAQELLLAAPSSHSTVFVNLSLSRVFNMTSSASLQAVARVLARIKMPPRARTLQKTLRIPGTALRMIQDGRQLYDAVLTQNWRVVPVQFGLPAPSQILAELIRAAGFEAILYRSTKGQGRCLAIFPDRLSSDAWVELVDPAPAAVRHRRLDDASADELSGWNDPFAPKRTS